PSQPAMITIAPCAVASAAAPGCAATDPPSPARLAHLQDGDVITSFNGQAIHTYADLQKAIRSARYGPADVTYQRDGHPAQTTVSLVPASRPPPPHPPGTPANVPAL